MSLLRRITWLLRSDTQIVRHCISLGVGGSHPVHGWMASSWPDKDSPSGFAGLSEHRDVAIDRCIEQERAFKEAAK